MDSIPLSVTCCGEEACAPSHGWGPAVRPYYLIHFVYSGRGTYYGPDGVHHLRAGQGFIIFPGEMSLYVADASDPWHYGWVGYSGEAASRLTGEAGLSLAAPVFAPPRAERMRGILAEICADVASMRAGEWSALGGLLRALAEIREGADLPQTDGALANSPYRKAVWFIEGNLAAGVRVADVAQFVGLCRSQLYRVFMAESGLSVQDWILRAKTRRAQSLLRSTSLKLSAVALSAGFASAEQLCHAFRRAGLSSPSEYRQRERERTGGC